MNQLDCASDRPRTLAICPPPAASCSVPPVAEDATWIGFFDGPADTRSNCPCGVMGVCPYDDLGRLCTSYLTFLSTSAVDPLETQAAIPEDSWLYVWAVAPFGISALETGFEGTLVPLEFVPEPGILWVPSKFPDVLLVMDGPDCRTGSILLGRLRVEDPTPVTGSSWGRVKARYRPFAADDHRDAYWGIDSSR
ncbi:MAG TPA: hypothetical protein VKU85_14800 [bacterium]|nr:hypothetical protein [bacterium]